MVRYQKPEQRRPSGLSKVLACVPCVRSAHHQVQEHRLPKSSPKLLNYLARDDYASQTRKLSSNSTCTSPISSHDSEGEEYPYNDELETLILSDSSDFTRCEVSAGSLPSLLEILEWLVKEEKHIMAYELVSRMEAFLMESKWNEHTWSDAERNGVANVRATLHEPTYAKRMNKIKSRGPGLKRLLELTNDLDETWKVVGESAGIKTWYRPGKGDTVQVRSEGVFNCGLGELVVLLKEGDFFSHWFPLCSTSNLLHSAGVDVVTRIILGVKHVFTRDVVFEAYGCDCTYADTMLFMARSIDDHPDCEVPPAPTGWIAGRLGIEAGFRFQAIDENTTRAFLDLDLDPRMPGMQKITSLLIKNVGAYILPNLRHEACKPQKDYIKWAPANTIKSNPDFYYDFLCRKLKDLHDRRGWAMATTLIPIIGSKTEDIPKSEPCPPIQVKRNGKQGLLRRTSSLPEKDNEMFWSCESLTQLLAECEVSQQ